MKSRARIVGDNISRLRKHQGLTQEELATGLAIHPSYIGLIERGERVPSIRTLESMAEYFGVSSADLMIEKTSEEGLDLRRQQLISFAQAANPADLEKLFQIIQVMYPETVPAQKPESRKKR